MSNNCNCNWCGCYCRNIHPVISYEETEELAKKGENCNFILLHVCKPETTHGQFFCIKFANIPSGNTSYPLKVEINEEIIPLVHSNGDSFNSSELCRGMILSGRYCTDKLIVRVEYHG